MRPDSLRTSFQFGSGLTRVGRILLLVYGTVYVLELLSEHWLHLPIVRHLVLYPPGHPLFRFWQILTHPFLHDPNAPLGFLITCLVFYFFSAPVEQRFGTRGFLVLFYVSAAGAAVTGLLLSAVTGLGGPFFGMLPSLLSLIVVFGLMHPEATILLMFVLPVKAKYLSYGTVLVTVLTFLAKANPNGAYQLGGILLGYIVFRGPGNLLHPRHWVQSFLLRRVRKRRDRFTVIEGSKGKDTDDRGPTYH